LHTGRADEPPAGCQRSSHPKKGVQVALLFLFFHKRLCGPLANSRFHHCPNTHHKPASKLEAAYHRADKAIQQIVDLLAASPFRGNCRTLFVYDSPG
jgi:hypothetical protein